MIKSIRPGPIVYWVSMILLPFMVTEGAVRYLRLAPELTKHANYVSRGPVRYIYAPHSSEIRGSREFKAQYFYNSRGFRDREHEEAKPKGTIRLIGIGDSFTEGETVDYQDSYLVVLEDLLNSRGGPNAPAEIIKAGVGGYDAEDERILFEHELIRYRPDIILVGFHPNDVWSAYYGYSPTLTKDGYLVSKEAYKLGDGAMFLYVHSHVMRIILKKIVEGLISKGTPYDWDRAYEPDGAYEKGWRKVEAEYEKLSRMADSIGARLVIINIPDKPFANPKRVYAGERLKAWCERHHAELVDLFPVMMKAPDPESLYWKLDTHCTARGYRLIAEAVYRHLAT